MKVIYNMLIIELRYIIYQVYFIILIGELKYKKLWLYFIDMINDKLESYVTNEEDT